MWEKYGPPETLRMAEVEKPSPDADEVLVKVLATSVNAADWHSLRGKPPLFARHPGPAAAETDPKAAARRRRAPQRSSRTRHDPRC
jgi:NADPH:quinone reductase-like Zn-dependent oxidoreductase